LGRSSFKMKKKHQENVFLRKMADENKLIQAHFRRVEIATAWSQDININMPI